jgi:hypothetical protein
MNSQNSYYHKLDHIYSEKWWNLIKSNIKKINLNKISSNKNLTLDILLNNLDLEWNWDKICLLDFVNFDIVRKYPHLKWNFYILLANKNFTWTIIHSEEFRILYEKYFMERCEINNKLLNEINITINNSNKLNMFYISQNPSITLDIIEENIDLNWYWYQLSRNLYITEDFLSKYINLNWDYIYILSRKEISWNFFEKYFDVLIRKYDDFIELISHHVNVTIDILENYDINWDYTWVSLNPNITIDYVLNNLDKTWDWYFLTIHPNISFIDIKNNFNLPWKINELSSSNKVKFSDILSTINEIKWNFKYVSFNPNITNNSIIENMNFDWDWSLIARNNNLNIFKFNDNIKKLINFQNASYSHLGINFIEKNSEINYDWDLISTTSFDNDKLEFVKNSIKSEFLIIFGKKLCKDVIINILNYCM